MRRRAFLKLSAATLAAGCQTPPSDQVASLAWPAAPSGNLGRIYFFAEEAAAQEPHGQQYQVHEATHSLRSATPAGHQDAEAGEAEAAEEDQQEQAEQRAVDRHVEDERSEDQYGQTLGDHQDHAAEEET